MTLKGDGKPFNPTLPANYQAAPCREEVHIGLKIVYLLGAAITYKYMYGLNVMTVVVE